MITSNTKQVLSETLRAYADCGLTSFSNAMSIRSLRFHATESCTPNQARRIMKQDIPDGYNNFNADLLSKFPPSCEIWIAREMSVCLYVVGDNLPSKQALGADEYDVQPDGFTRIWWD